MTEFDITDTERLLATSPDHRVLKRVPHAIDWPLAKSDGSTKRALFINARVAPIFIAALALNQSCDRSRQRRP